MVDNASPLEVPTGRLLSGMLRVRRSFTRFDFTYSRLVKSYPAPQLPGHKGTVTCVDFHPKEPVSESAVPRHQSLPTNTLVRQFSPAGRTVSCLLANSNKGSLSEKCTALETHLIQRGLNIDALFLLAEIIWYTVLRCYVEKSKVKLWNLGKIETWDNLGNRFHVPHVQTSANRVSVLVGTGDLNPVC